MEVSEILYRGYLRGDGKHAATKIKGKKLLSFETVRKETSYVGILDDEYICVDVDNKADSKKLLKIVKDLNLGCSVLETNHGMHFYFKGYDLKTNKIGWFTPLGIKADFKLGIKNTADPLKINGAARHWIYRGESWSELPKWLYPVNNHHNSLSNLTQGDRNQKLFNYILTLQTIGMSRDEIKYTIKLINKYILDEPLPDSEIKVILRNEAFLKQSFYKDKKFLHEKFGQFLISEHHIIPIANVLHIYQNGIYSDDVADIEKAMIKHIESINRSTRQEVLSYLQLKSEERSLADVK